MVSVLPVERSGLASGINNTFRQLGIAIGIAGLGAIFEHQASEALGARAASSPALTPCSPSPLRPPSSPLCSRGRCSAGSAQSDPANWISVLDGVGPQIAGFPDAYVRRFRQGHGVAGDSTSGTDQGRLAGGADRPRGLHPPGVAAGEAARGNRGDEPQQFAAAAERLAPFRLGDGDRGRRRLAAARRPRRRRRGARASAREHRRAGQPLPARPHAPPARPAGGDQPPLRASLRARRLRRLRAGYPQRRRRRRPGDGAGDRRRGAARQHPHRRRSLPARGGRDLRARSQPRHGRSGADGGAAARPARRARAGGGAADRGRGRRRRLPRARGRRRRAAAQGRRGDVAGPRGGPAGRRRRARALQDR